MTLETARVVRVSSLDRVSIVWPLRVRLKVIRFPGEYFLAKPVFISSFIRSSRRDDLIKWVELSVCPSVRQWLLLWTNLHFFFICVFSYFRPRNRLWFHAFRIGHLSVCTEATSGGGHRPGGEGEGHSLYVSTFQNLPTVSAEKVIKRKTTYRKSMPR